MVVLKRWWTLQLIVKTRTRKYECFRRKRRSPRPSHDIMNIWICVLWRTINSNCYLSSDCRFLFYNDFDGKIYKYIYVPLREGRKRRYIQHKTNLKMVPDVKCRNDKQVSGTSTAVLDFREPFWKFDVTYMPQDLFSNHFFEIRKKYLHWRRNHWKETFLLWLQPLQSISIALTIFSVSVRWRSFHIWIWQQKSFFFHFLAK